MRTLTSLCKDKDDCFIVCVPTYKTWNQATSIHFNGMFAGKGEHQKQDGTFTLHKTKQKIYIRSLDNPWSIEGITNCRGIWCDEAGQFKYQAWVNVMGRAAFREAPIFSTTTPYALNWLYHDIYRPWTEGKLPDTDIFQWRSIDNPYFPKAEYERQKAMLDARVFAMKYEGTFQKMAGLVYEDFDRVLNGYEAFDWKPMKDLYYVYAGVDWGYSNPFAIVVRILRKDGEQDFQIDEFMRSYMTPQECVLTAKDFQQKYGIEMWYCDEEAPDYIAAFNSAGLKASPVKKGAGSVMAGIGLHQGLVKTRQHMLFKGRCPQTVDEYETYAFPERDGREENLSENPVDANNHLLSATRYITMATQWIRDKVKRESKFKPELQNPHIADLLKRHSQKTSWEYV